MAGATVAAFLSKQQSAEESELRGWKQHERGHEEKQDCRYHKQSEDERTNTASFEAAYDDWITFLESGKLPSKSKK